jgi:hypothetical protein
MKLTFIVWESGDWAHIYVDDKRVYCGHYSDIAPTDILDIVFEYGLLEYEEYVMKSSMSESRALEGIKSLSAFFETENVTMTLVTNNSSRELL